RLLRIFLHHPGRVLSRDQLMDLLQGRETDPFERSIDVQVSRLRHRLADDAKEASIIKTVRGEGYILATQVEAGR
ncbi:MAG: helix-turn-helix domain-containing protein, partial [Sulfurimicrobium sp.]|nr:helix-turn-helix domain-containing protein [Sulfurimicrobium sp.]